MPNPPRLHRRWGTERPRFLDEKKQIERIMYGHNRLGLTSGSGVQSGWDHSNGILVGVDSRPPAASLAGLESVIWAVWNGPGSHCIQNTFTAEYDRGVYLYKAMP
jgi:hypothetical protein